MNIVACVKQILDTTDVRFDADTHFVKREGQATTINSLDEYAVEEGLRLKEQHGGTVTVLTMGPAQAADTIKHAIAMGADEAVHVSDPALAGSDCYATAKALAHALAKMGEVDLVICGAESVDGNTAYVGQALAALLQVPHVTFVCKIEQLAEGKMTVQRLMEEGYDRLEVSLPAVITVVKAINEPRISSLKGKMRAKKFQPKTMALADLGLAADQVGTAGSTARVLRTFPPVPRPSGVIFDGEPDEIAEKLYRALKG